MQAYTAQDILEFDGELLTNFGEGDVAVITYPNELHGMKTGKGGNTIGAHNEMGREAELSLRVIKGSPDDKRLNSKIIAWKTRSSDFTPSTASFTKIISVDGGVANEVTSLKFGLPVKVVETKENTEGDTEQVISVYTFRFGDSDRALA
jgi:hypothetical protein